MTPIDSRTVGDAPDGKVDKRALLRSIIGDLSALERRLADGSRLDADDLRVVARRFMHFIILSLADDGDA